MRVFVTGATGFIGSAVVAELQKRGHSVVGLARSEAAARRLAEMGASAHGGDLSDLASLAAGARSADGVIHLAFGLDFSRYLELAEHDRRVVAAMASELEGSDRGLVATSVTTLLADGVLGTELDGPAPGNPIGARAATEEAVMAAAGRGVRACAVRLPPSVHGAGDRGFVPALIGCAQRTGVSAYLADGANRWPAVHRLDAARLFCDALEGAAPGARFHAAADEGVPLRDIAQSIGAGLELPTRSIDSAAAQAHFDWLALFVGIDNPVSSALTHSTLSWRPQESSLLEDLRSPDYFATAAAA